MIVKFRSAEDAARVDLTRVGVVAGASGNGLTVEVEPQIDGWGSVPEGTRNEIVRSTLAAAGVWAEVS